jgi:hypothetical protein
MSNTIFRPSDLEQLLQNVIIEQMPERMFTGNKILSTTPVALGARIVTLSKANVYGRAAFVTWGNTQDIPTVDVFIEEVSIPVHPLKIKYGITEDEILSANFAGIDVRSPRVEAAVQALLDRIEDTGTIGNTKLGIYGVANQPNANIVVPSATGVGGLTTFASKDAEGCADMLFALVTEAGSLSRNAYKTTTLLIPVNTLYTLSNKRSLAQHGRSALELFGDSIKQVYSDIKVIPCPYLDTAGPGGVPIAIALSPNPKHGGYVRVPNVRNSPVETYQGSMEGRMSAYLAGVMFTAQISISSMVGI